MTKWIGLTIVAGITAVFATIVVLLILHFRPAPQVEVDEDGRTIAKIVNVKLETVSTLQVMRLTGTVQGAACVTWWKVLHPCRVFKAPAQVLYSVDAAQLRLADFRWNAAAKTLLIDVPDVAAGPVTIDNAKVVVDRTDGIFVPIGAMAELQRRSSASAQRVAREEANKPANLQAARARARTEIERLFALPLRVASVDADVQVRFPGEARPSSAQWDVSRSLQDVLRDAK